MFKVNGFKSAVMTKGEALGLANILIKSEIENEDNDDSTKEILSDMQDSISIEVFDDFDADKNVDLFFDENRIPTLSVGDVQVILESCFEEIQSEHID